jgi:hypothetical protein
MLAGIAQSKRLNRESRRVLLAVGLLLVMIGVTIHERYAIRGRDDDRDLMTVAAFLQTHTQPAELIETYDSELFLFLNRPYTYAPADVLVQIIRHHQRLGPSPTYDPLSANPHYLVVGDYGRWAGFYKPLLEQNRIRLVKTIGRYQIYEPVN